MSHIVVNLNISADEYKKMYAGVASSVHARAVDGRRIRFPASALRPFVTQRGVQGVFAIEFDRDCKLLGLRQL